jgi:plastocyanin
VTARSIVPAAGLIVTAALALLLAGGAPTQADTRPPATLTVRMGDFFYRPATLVAHVGDRVRFLNVGRIQHTVADTDGHGKIRSRLIHPRPLRRGQAQVVRVLQRGTIRYLCTFHPTLMRGVISVR